MAGEVLDFWSVLVDHVWVCPLECRDELGDVVDLGIVEHAGADFLLQKRSASIQQLW